MEKTPLEIIQTLKDVPAMPNVIIKALNIIKDDKAGTKELSEIMSYDQALTSQVLKLVNSAYYGFAQEITSIKNAIALLGMTQTKNIVIAVALKPMLTSQCGRDMWKHSIKAAIACEHIAKCTDTIDSADAFTIGFLHDIGKVILNLSSNQKYQDVMNRVKDGEDELVAEENVFGINHTEAGFLLVKRWRLPVLLANCIKYHHDPFSSSMQKASCLIYIANQICQPEENNIDKRALEEFNIDMSTITQFKEEVNELMESFFVTFNEKV